MHDSGIFTIYNLHLKRAAALGEIMVEPQRYLLTEYEYNKIIQMCILLLLSLFKEFPTTSVSVLKVDQSDSSLTDPSMLSWMSARVL